MDNPGDFATEDTIDGYLNELAKLRNENLRLDTENKKLNQRIIQQKHLIGFLGQQRTKYRKIIKEMKEKLDSYNNKQLNLGI